MSSEVTHTTDFKSLSVSPATNIGGLYTDPFHSPISCSANIFALPSPWFGGIRIGGVNRDTPGKIVFIGNDDGVHWWTLRGSWTDKKAGTIKIDFTAKAPAVGILNCSYEPGAVSFLNNKGGVDNTWSRLKPTANFDFVAETRHAAFNDINGFYFVSASYKPGSFAGIRVVSDRVGKFISDELVIIGSDDGEHFWALEGGTYTDRLAGTFSIGDDNSGTHLSGIIISGTITFENGDKWIKATPKSDIHALPHDV